MGSQCGQAKNGFDVTLHTSDKAEAQRWFEQLSEGGKAVMPFGETFWSPGFGSLVDRFGIPDGEYHSSIRLEAVPELIHKQAPKTRAGAEGSANRTCWEQFSSSVQGCRRYLSGKSMRISYRWMIVAAGGLLGCVAAGAMFSLPVLLRPIAQETGWSITGISSAMTFGFLAMAAASIVWGSFSDRFGPARSCWQAR